ncbi:MAG: hypothetical protein ACLU9S_17560 [Oscillospiraceae bacterium]
MQHQICNAVASTADKKAALQPKMAIKVAIATRRYPNFSSLYYLPSLHNYAKIKTANLSVATKKGYGSSPPFLGGLAIIFILLFFVDNPDYW